MVAGVRVEEGVVVVALVAMVEGLLNLLPGKVAYITFSAASELATWRG